ncbi:amidase [Pseudonocardia kujensis]|uniref:amidase n=1 Tax=Pseudonocardia kujensis TaxID=1128675 RepID=UPI001E4FE6CB|nr:amidase [Pseudonocardia kujensis]MCE0764555.1 amidase [Pseudonocardia kujensis]
MTAPTRSSPFLRGGVRRLSTGAAQGPLQDLEYVVKDLIDVAGSRTGAGNPTWLAGQAPAPRSAPVVAALAAAGADCVGKAHTDEFAFSLAGVNAHYGPSTNPAVPGATAGGSSSGSAAAVAAGLVPFALGTDTGGSVRVPASYCGTVGVRPTHGRVSLRGVTALAPSFDTVGWFTRDADLAATVGSVLLDGAPRTARPRRLVVLHEVLAGLPAAVADAVLGSAAAAAADLGLDISRTGLGVPLDEYATVFTTIQAAEAWRVRGAWLRAHPERVSPDVLTRFRAGADVDDRRLAQARRDRARLAAVLHQTWDDGTTIVVVPSTASPAPDHEDLAGPGAAAIRAATLRLTSLAGIAGAPVVGLPLAKVAGRPLGIGLLGPPGTDEILLRLATVLEGR